MALEGISKRAVWKCECGARLVVVWWSMVMVSIKPGYL